MPTVITRPGKVAQWGNSAAIRIGTAVLENANLHLHDAVDVIAGEDEMIIRRRLPRLTMAALLDEFDLEKHRHEMTLDVDPVGTETS